MKVSAICHRGCQVCYTSARVEKAVCPSCGAPLSSEQQGQLWAALFCANSDRTCEKIKEPPIQLDVLSGIDLQLTISPSE